jgi:hypothetical protein
MSVPSVRIASSAASVWQSWRTERDARDLVLCFLGRADIAASVALLKRGTAEQSSTSGFG